MDQLYLMYQVVSSPQKNIFQVNKVCFRSKYPRSIILFFELTFTACNQQIMIALTEWNYSVGDLWSWELLFAKITINHLRADVTNVPTKQIKWSPFAKACSSTLRWKLIGMQRHVSKQMTSNTTRCLWGHHVRLKLNSQVRDASADLSCQWAGNAAHQCFYFQTQCTSFWDSFILNISLSVIQMGVFRVDLADVSARTKTTLPSSWQHDSSVKQMDAFQVDLTNACQN